MKLKLQRPATIAAMHCYSHVCPTTWSIIWVPLEVRLDSIYYFCLDTKK